MVRFILGTNFVEKDLVKKALTSFYGVGPEVCRRLMARHSIHPRGTVGQLEEKQVLDLTADLSEMRVENDLRRHVQENLVRLKNMGSYRGKRHAMGLPVRGQRTRNQIYTARKLNRIDAHKQ
ncbi:40S ribosomal protein s13 [Saccharata proteae CBS 121410]|uniref:40S ribosomal protein s13 n=1 Tax=Saccharata proteae CBS 121410 TaxID=1314787 RepID=A0A9P4LXJ1_9PEZI|nr:40S ribosomal protein s13 [Saccharata proteae CBS 121410]